MKETSFSSEFDFSQYPKDHELYDPTNLKVLGKMKDESNSYPLLEIVGLGPKLYSYRSLKLNTKTDKVDEIEVNKGKGITETARVNQLSFEKYKNCLNTMEPQNVKIQNIISDHHRLFSIQMNKVGLSVGDVKRYILPDGISTLAHGHYKIKV